MDGKPVPDDFPRQIRWLAVWKPWGLLFVLSAAPLYTLSIGPAIAMVGCGYLEAESVAYAYRPILIAQWNLPKAVRELSRSYMELWGVDASNEVSHQHFMWKISDWSNIRRRPRWLDW